MQLRKTSFILGFGLIMASFVMQTNAMDNGKKLQAEKSAQERVNALAEERGLSRLHLTDEDDEVALLIAQKADVNVRDNQGDTPLHDNAIYLGKALLLLSAHADVNAKNNRGRTPLHELARFSSHVFDVAQALIDHNAEVDVLDKFGKMPLHYVTDVSMLQFLIKNKADIDGKTVQGKTFLQGICEKGMRDQSNLKELISELIKSGAGPFDLDVIKSDEVRLFVLKQFQEQEQRRHQSELSAIAMELEKVALE